MLLFRFRFQNGNVLSDVSAVIQFEFFPSLLVYAEQDHLFLVHGSHILQGALAVGVRVWHKILLFFCFY